MRDILEDVRRELNPICNGDSEKYPAASCKEICDCNSTAPSGNYWIRNSTEGTLQVYSLMETLNCGDTRGGWMSTAYICKHERRSNYLPRRTNYLHRRLKMHLQLKSA